MEIPQKFKGKAEFYEKMMRIFVKSMPAWADFDTAIKDIDGLKVAVHTIKGTAGNLELQEVWQCALQFETSLRNNEPNRDLYQMFVDACDQVRALVPLEP